MVNMEVNLGGLKMRTPVTTASGTFGYGTEYVGAADYSKLGAVTVKGVRRDPWPGNPMPRHAEVIGGLVNAIGLQGPGVDLFVGHYLKHYVRTVGEDAPPVIVNIWGGSVEEYADVARRLTEAANPIVGALEMNVSCPNVKAGGHTFGQDPKVLSEVVSAVRAATSLPLFVKLAPNVPSIAPYVKACEDAGADALSLINTIPAMVIDQHDSRDGDRRRDAPARAREPHGRALRPVRASGGGEARLRRARRHEAADSRDGRRLRGEGRNRVLPRRGDGGGRGHGDFHRSGRGGFRPRWNRRLLRAARF